MPVFKELIKQLSPELQQEVIDFAEFLQEKREKKHREKPLFKWAGALKDLRDQYTSIELQHEISKWRIGDK